MNDNHVNEPEFEIQEQALDHFVEQFQRRILKRISAALQHGIVHQYVKAGETGADICKESPDRRRVAVRCSPH